MQNGTPSLYRHYRRQGLCQDAIGIATGSGDITSLSLTVPSNLRLRLRLRLVPT
jgi:hypothetical protein